MMMSFEKLLHVLDHPTYSFGAYLFVALFFCLTSPHCEGCGSEVCSVPVDEGRAFGAELKLEFQYYGIFKNTNL